MSILRYLPRDAALTLRQGGWTFDTHVAVRTLEEVAALTRITMAAAGVRKSKLPEPLLIPRPGDAPPPRKAQTGWVQDLLDVTGIEVVEA